MGQTVSRTRKPKRAFGGLKRKLIRNLLNALQSIQKMDERETATAAKLSVSPIHFRNLGGVSLQTNIAGLVTRCTDALAAKVGSGAAVVPQGPTQ